MVGRPRSELVEILGRTRLFAGLTKRQLNAIAKVCAERSYAAGDVLVKQLDHGQQMVVLVSGRAKVDRDGLTIGSARPGDVVGEMSLIDGLPCSATVVAETPIEAIIVFRTAFRRLRQTVPALTEGLLLAQTARVRELDRRAAALG
jgi:CRP/FNR family transcriptional regulator, cyclic AMP receptor protein